MIERIPISTLLKCIQDLEEASAALYGFYADIFEHNERAAAVFRQLRREEEGHRNQAALQARIVQKNPEKFGEITVDLSEIKHLVAEIDEHIQGGIFDLGDAVAFALELEENASEIHYRTLATKLNPELISLASFLRGGDELHLQKLKDLAYELSREK